MKASKVEATNKVAIKGDRKRIGNYNTLEEAIRAHDNEKRKAIRNIAKEYKPVIPNKLYEALLNW